MTTALFYYINEKDSFLGYQLTSILEQQNKPDELYVLDTTGDESIASLCQQLQTQAAFQIEHLQLTKETAFGSHLNYAAAQSKADYNIVIDRHSILHPKCIQHHVKKSKRGLFLSGTCSYFSKVEAMNQAADYNAFSKLVRKSGSAFYFPLSASLSAVKSQIDSNSLTTNISFWREDFNLVNGYDEDFESQQFAGLDLLHRFLNLGIQFKKLKGAAFAYQSNELGKNSKSSSDEKRLQKSNDKKRIVAVNGLDKY